MVANLFKLFIKNSKENVNIFISYFIPSYSFFFFFFASEIDLKFLIKNKIKLSFIS